MIPITETMRWAIEQAIAGKYRNNRSTTKEAWIENSLHELEKSNGEYGVSSESLVAALRIACRELDFINRKIQHGCTDMSCGLCDKERLK